MKKRMIDLQEEWKDILGFEGRYQISNLGRVKSLVSERILKECQSSNGYMRVCLCGADGHKNMSVHRMVADAFISNPNDLPQVNHIDENKQNNRVDNLEWVTSKQNINHGTSLARRSYHQRYTQSGKKVVHQYDMEGNLIGTFISIREAARHYGIDRTGIQHCCTNKKGFKTYKGYKWKFEEEKKEA